VCHADSVGNESSFVPCRFLYFVSRVFWRQYQVDFALVKLPNLDLWFRKFATIESSVGYFFLRQFLYNHVTDLRQFVVALMHLK
jgi:hypothetical protein